MGAHKLSTAWSQPRIAIRDDGNDNQSGFAKSDLEKNDVQVLHVLKCCCRLDGAFELPKSH